MHQRFSLFLAVCLAAVPAALSADSVVEEIIARVNNQIITRSEYLREKEQLKQEVQQQEPGNADKAYAEREKDVLRGLMDQDLLLDKGKDLGITADTDMIKRLSKMLIWTQKADGDKAAAADPDPQQLAAAEAKAKDLLDQIRKDASFEEVAKKNSDGPTAAQGGDLGEFKRGVLSKELEDKTFAMKPGEVSDVIRTKQGFVILKVTEHAQAGIQP